MRDATEIERRGVPAVALITRPFKVTADSMAARQGYPGYRYVLVDHPIASLDDHAIRERACAAWPVILDVLGLTAVQR
jgi:hypothetical protein